METESFAKGQPAEEPDDETLVNALLTNSAEFAKLRPFPPLRITSGSCWHSNAQPTFRTELADHARNTRILVHGRVAALLERFLVDRRGPNNTPPERTIYTKLTVTGFIRRLIRCRPLMFIGKQVESPRVYTADKADVTHIQTVSPANNMRNSNLSVSHISTQMAAITRTVFEVATAVVW